MTLPDLTPPAGGANQALIGSRVRVQDLEPATVAPPTEAPGTNFDYGSRTNNFAAVNAYYHNDRVLPDGRRPRLRPRRLLRRHHLPGPRRPPRPVRHRTASRSTHSCPANGTGGIGHVGYALCRPRRHRATRSGWRSTGGCTGTRSAGTASSATTSARPTSGSAHSAGDGFAAIQIDPESALRALPERFRYAPFRAFPPSAGSTAPSAPAWAWGGANDDGGYGSEQILRTCHFRIYRAIGGDSADLGRARFASRVATYLILRAVGDADAGDEPGNATALRQRPDRPADARRLDERGPLRRRLQQGDPVGVREAGPVPGARRADARSRRRARRRRSTSTSTTAAPASTSSSRSTGTSRRCGTARAPTAARRTRTPWLRQTNYAYVQGQEPRHPDGEPASPSRASTACRAPA